MGLDGSLPCLQSLQDDWLGKSTQAQFLSSPFKKTALNPFSFFSSPPVISGVRSSR